MIISASRRTDVPAFFGEWLVNRLRAGYCKVRNPFNPHQVNRLELTPETVDAIVFWTRDPRPFTRALEELDARGFRYVFLMTITGYPRELEAATPSLDDQIEALQQLEQRIGCTRIAWRYDPILLSNHTNESWHLDNFSKIGEKLATAIDHGIISLIDYYRKSERHLKPLEATGWKFRREPDAGPAFDDFVRHLAERAKAIGVRLQTCCESHPSFAAAGILAGSCIDQEWLNRSLSLHLKQTGRDRGQRPGCLCAPSKDLGSNHTCRHACRYCYATQSHDPAKLRQHDPLTEFL
ncbi:MAG TPA: DUF1848 domain-containing protein [Candidatus Ozemobacteraceae bacterium]|nr:DUF1848 domain-containing protein [Candidatus Ozemobacteraceae bacterium]